MMKSYGVLNRVCRYAGMAACILSVALCSCGGDGDENLPLPPSAEEEGDDNVKPDPEALPDISSYKAGETLTMEFNGVFRLPCTGIDPEDHLQLISQGNMSETYNVPVVNIDDEGALLRTPSGFIGGMFQLLYHKDNGSAIDLGITFVDVVDASEVQQVPGNTVYGRVIDASGKPIPGVSVSDGVFVTTTDENGCYYLASLKKYGYVFISVPGGYRVAVDRTIPQFFRRLEAPSSTYEQCCFILAAESNERHRILVYTDTHLANRTNDINQFKQGFKADLKAEITRARAEGVALYAMALGDLSWDEWWYVNRFQPSDYVSQMSDLDLPVYNIPGNHDNDPYVADDFESTVPWRDEVGPTYYSFNIGDIHYVQMDNTLFVNSGGAQGTVGALNYTEGFTDDQLRWLAADLKNVPAGTTLFLGMHIQYTNRYKVENGDLTWSYAMPAEYRSRLAELLAPYKVHLVTGHTHINYTNFIDDGLMEHNIAAVCATWWWTGYYTDGRCQMCRDGSPGGYKVFDIGEGAPDNVSWRYQPIGRSADYQFRCYDLNETHITRETYCPRIANNFSTVSAEFFSQYANGYDRARSDNAVLINVFDWNERWSLKVVEVETNKELYVTQLDTYDPLHTVHFNMNRMNTNSTAMTFPTLLTSHMFEVFCSSATSTLEITVTDEFGRSYVETMKRPRSFYDMTLSSQW